MALVLPLLGGLGLLFVRQANATPKMTSSDHHYLVSGLKLLEQTPTGERLLQEARQIFKVNTLQNLASEFSVGQSSRTDTTLVREFDLDTGKEKRTVRRNLTLQKGQTSYELALDLAHELTHATTPSLYDPYDPKLTVGKFVEVSIEGRGGEIDALLGECQAALEFYQLASQEASESQNTSKFESRSDLLNPPKRCLHFYDPQKKERLLTRKEVKKGFYQVGHWQKFVRESLEEPQLLTDLSSEAPILYSSTGHAPYPVALIREYLEMTEIACKNTQRRQSRLQGNLLDSLFGKVTSQSAVLKKPHDQNKEQKKQGSKTVSSGTLAQSSSDILNEATLKLRCQQIGIELN